MQGKSRKLIVAQLFFITSLGVYAQESLEELSVNPYANAKWLHLQNQAVNFKTNSTADTIDINTRPFLDDFSKNEVYPDTAWWTDRLVYINRDYPVAPLTVGAATFDGLNERGLPYDWTSQESAAKAADTLTSRHLDLTIGDSIYLSFYYQAKGRGDAPEPADSLILEFRSPVKNWTKVWYKNGYAPSGNDTSFHLVMMKITDADYLKRGFQFRFRNYATLSGSIDHWHLDYVYLNKSRTISDTLREDVAFVYNPPSLLKNYQAMPWEQYNSGEMNSNLKVYIRNNMNVDKNTFYSYQINGSGGTLSNVSQGGCNLHPFATEGYISSNCSAFSTPVISYAFNPLSDTATFFAEHRLVTAPDEDTLNNKIIFYQKFHNYFAYDDGTAEKAYVVTSSELYSYLANRFTLNTGDTLKAFLAYFAPAYENVSQGGAKPFPIKIMVWDDNGGYPGNIIYQADTVVYAEYEPWHNSFHTFKVGASGIALGSGTFYVGWQQINSYSGNPPKIRIGFDVNTNSKSNIFYNTAGYWATTQFNGSLMIRPVMRQLFSSGIDDKRANKPDNIVIDVYPNPANDYVELRSVSAIRKDHLFGIYDMFGRNIVGGRLDHYPAMVDLSGVANGIYFICIRNKNGQTIQVSKLTVAH